MSTPRGSARPPARWAAPDRSSRASPAPGRRRRRPRSRRRRTRAWPGGRSPRDARRGVSLLQQPRQAPVLEDLAARLLLGAVTHDVVLVVDRLDRRAAARAGLALVAVDLQRQR